MVHYLHLHNMQSHHRKKKDVKNVGFGGGCELVKAESKDGGDLVHNTTMAMKI